MPQRLPLLRHRRQHRLVRALLFGCGPDYRQHEPAPVEPSAPAPSSHGGSGKMIVFMILGILAGAAAAVAAVKFLLKI